MGQCKTCGGILRKDGSCTKCEMKTRVAQEACRVATRGQTKYCGYVIGQEITCEQVERLFHFLHANYTAVELISMRDEQLHDVAEDNKEEWQ